LEADFENMGKHQNSAVCPDIFVAPQCGARVSSRLSPPKYSSHFFFPPLPGESNQEGTRKNIIAAEPSIAEDPYLKSTQEEMSSTLLALKKRVENEEPDACIEYAQLLMTGDKGVKKNQVLAQYFIDLGEGLLAQNKRHEKVYDSLAALVERTTTEEKIDNEKIEKNEAIMNPHFGKPKEDASLAALIARIQSESGSKEDYMIYASLLLVGEGVEQNEGLAEYLLRLADQQPENQKKIEPITDIDMFYNSGSLNNGANNENNNFPRLSF
jgi:hypothetical protein